MITVLCVAKNSVYKSLDCDCFDADRDCRTFSGCGPVVAHPPCRAWSAFCSHQAKPAPGEKELAPFCVDVVRRNGGILEHPAHSKLWNELSLPRPGEYQPEWFTLWVRQSWWGDQRDKETWLLVSRIGIDDIQLPLALNPTGCTKAWNRMSKGKRQSTPIEMAQWLIDTASKVTELVR